MFFRKNLKYILVVLVLLTVVFVSLRGADTPLKGFFVTASSPFLKTVRIFSGGISGLFDFLGSIGDLKGENEKLVSENQNLLAELNKLKDTEKENQFLRDQLKLLPRSKYDLEASFIIAQDPQGLGNYFIIDKGGNAGMKTGMPAIVSSGILVGRISEVYPTSAKVMLVTDPGSAVNAETESNGARGILKGEYGLGLKMDMVSQTEVLNEGDEVITSGLGGEIPRGLTLGRLGKISQSEDKLFQQASVISAVNLSTLRSVFVIKK